MTDPNLTYIQGVIDRSGSMSNIASATAASWNTLVAEQAKEPGRCLVGLTQFDDRIESVYDFAEAGQAQPYELLPRNKTALLDAVGMTIVRLGEAFSAMPEGERPSKVIFCILTDGHENASTEYDRAKVKALIEQQTNDYGWQFMFLGADMEAVNDARSWGVSDQNSSNYNTANAGQTMVTNSSRVAAFRASGIASDLGYTDEDRANLTK